MQVLIHNHIQLLILAGEILVLESTPLNLLHNYNLAWRRCSSRELLVLRQRVISWFDVALMFL